MKHYKTVTLTLTEQLIDRVTCDRCECDIPTAELPELRDFELYFASGTYDRDGGGEKSGWKIEDLCDGCIAQLQRVLIDSGFPVDEFEENW